MRSAPRLGSFPYGVIVRRALEFSTVQAVIAVVGMLLKRLPIAFLKTALYGKVPIFCLNQD